MGETRVCGTCRTEKPISDFYRYGRPKASNKWNICKSCMHGPSPRNLRPIPKTISASFAVGLADVIDQIGRMKRG